MAAGTEEFRAFWGFKGLTTYDEVRCVMAGPGPGVVEQGALLLVRSSQRRFRRGCTRASNHRCESSTMGYHF